MPPGRKPSHSKEEYVAQAIAYADEHGLDAVTLRALGSTMRVSTTAVYRYFPDKDALFSAMRDSLLGEVVSRVNLKGGPRDVISGLAASYRHIAIEHPCLSQLMVIAQLQGPNSDAVPNLVGGAIRALGVSDDQLPLAYRQLETFVVGSTLFDFSAAPQHLSSRRERLQRSTELGFDRAFPDDASIEATNEAAFMATLDLIIDTLVAQARRSE